jgi:Flp pilus assembly protein TadD
MIGICVSAVLCAPLLSAGDLRINFPKNSPPTPVQKLNQEGVRQIQHHNLAKAERLFYRAYLIDPDDPFTLNNLGYISELQGKADRAERYYQLAAKENNSETVIAEASARKLKGHELREVTSAYGNLDLRINRGNVQAMSLLEQGRNQEAEDVLRDTLKLDPRNPFTLNNLGYAVEGQGDLEEALRYYDEASMTHSKEPVVVAVDFRWRGRPISDIAFRNLLAVRKRLASERSNQERSARLNLEGVSAINHNDDKKAYDYFRQAYQLDPKNAFSLNNMGYLAEAQGDEETASDFYARARHGSQAGTPVSVASHHEMVGDSVRDVAGSNVEGADASLRAQAEVRRRQHAPVVLRRRNTPATHPSPENPSTAPQTQNPPVPRPPVDNAPVENNVPRPPQ